MEEAWVGLPSPKYRREYIEGGKGVNDAFGRVIRFPANATSVRCARSVTIRPIRAAREKTSVRVEADAYDWGSNTNGNV